MAFNEARKIRAHRLKLEKNIKDAVTIMGNDALNHFKKSFENQGFTDDDLVKWKPRKRTRVRGRDDTTRAILVKTGNLRRSLKRVAAGKLAIRISSNVPYAVFHNDGTTRLPKRQFVGHSKKLITHLRNKIDSKIKDAFK
jgi:phage gpG-like protein